jgi:hypothetical protein
MKRDVLFVTLAPQHLSARRRLEDAASDKFTVETYATDADKVRESIASRVLSGRYVGVFLAVLTTRAKVAWVWGHDAGFVGSLAAAFRPGLRLIWDISDVNPRLLGKGLGARALRFLESLLVRRADRLFLTSPTFYDRYYAPLIARERVKVVENKHSGGQRNEVTASPASGPLRIVMAGIFRSPEVLRLIDECARRIGSRVVFELYGYAGRSIPPELMETLAGNPQVRLMGEYDGNQLQAIYRDAHLVWGFVDPTENDNEKWLLTNRIYDAITQRRPILTNAGTASGEYAAGHRVGLAMPMAADAVVGALWPLLDPSGESYKALVAQMPDPSTGYMRGDYARAIEELLDE